MGGRRHSDAVRAAVMAALLDGQGVNEVAAAHGLDHSVVSRWRKSLKARRGAPVHSGASHAPKTGESEAPRNAPADAPLSYALPSAAEIEALVYRGLVAHLQAAESIARVVSDPAYIKRQPANEIGVLLGIVTDKALRTLELVAGPEGDDAGG